jgi:hypothetical protein
MKIDGFHGFTHPIREGTRAVPDSRVPLFFLGEMSALGDGDAAHVARQPFPDL